MESDEGTQQGKNKKEGVWISRLRTAVSEAITNDVPLDNLMTVAHALGISLDKTVLGRDTIGSICGSLRIKVPSRPTRPVKEQGRVWLSTIRGDRSQQEIADMFGISQNHYSNIEIGKRNPGVALAKKMGRVLGFGWTRFYEDDDSRERSEKP